MSAERPASRRRAQQLAARNNGSSAIESVAEHGAADVGEMHADLVRAAGMGFDAEQCVAAKAFRRLVESAGLATRRMVGTNGHFFPLIGVHADRLIDQIAIPVGHTYDDCQVFLSGWFSLQIERPKRSERYRSSPRQ